MKILSRVNTFLICALACFVGTAEQVFANAPNVFGKSSGSSEEEKKQLQESFFKAVQEGNLVALKALLEAGISPDTVRKERDTSALADAAYKNKKELAALLLDYGANPNYISYGDITPLILAFTQRRDHREIAQMLCEYGANVNFVSSVYKSSAMDDLISHNNLVAGRLLREYGATVNRKDLKNLSTPAWQEIMAIKPTKVPSKLPTFGGKVPTDPDAAALAAKANPDSPWAACALYNFVQKGDITGVYKMLDAGMNPNIPNQSGNYPIVAAARDKHYEIIRMLLDYEARPDVVDPDKFNAVTYLIAQRGKFVPRAENIRLLQLFLDYNYPTNSANGWRSTALEDACYHGNTDAVKLLASYGAYDKYKAAFPSKSIRTRSSALAQALNTPKTLSPTRVPTCGGKKTPPPPVPAAPPASTTAPQNPPAAQTPAPAPELVVDPEKRYPSGETELHVACLEGNVAKVMALIQAGADVDATDNLRKTPLHKLCEGKIPTAAFLQILQTIIQKSPSALGERDSAGRIPFHYLCARPAHMEIQKMLELEPRQVNLAESNGERLTPLHMAVSSRSEKNVFVLIGAGAKPNVALRNGDTPLHHAVEKVCDKIVDVLTQSKGIKIDARDKQGMTPFLLASKIDTDSYPDSYSIVKSQIRIIKLLSERGADIKAVDKNRANALHYAAYDANPTVVELLLNLGVNVNAKDKKKRTPLDYAKYNTRAKPLLERYGAREG